MNVYEFEKTIYPHDLNLSFYLFCVKQQWGLILYAPLIFFAYLRLEFKPQEFAPFLSLFYRFLPKLKEREQVVAGFTKKAQGELAAWYLKQQGEDVILSRAPRFLVAPICEPLGVTVVASELMLETGKLEGTACFGDAKLSYLQSLTLEAPQKFYSAFASDRPLATYSHHAYRVRGGKFIQDDFEKEERVLLEFFSFIVIGVINTFNSTIIASILLPLLADKFISFIAGYALSLVFAYLLNSFFVFQKGLSWGRWGRFVISYIPNFIIQTVIVSFLLAQTAIPAPLIYATSSVISVPVTFVLLKLFAMK